MSGTLRTVVERHELQRQLADLVSASYQTVGEHFSGGNRYAGEGGDERQLSSAAAAAARTRTRTHGRVERSTSCRVSSNIPTISSHSV